MTTRSHSHRSGLDRRRLIAPAAAILIAPIVTTGLVSAAGAAPTVPSASPRTTAVVPYENPKLPVATRVKDLLGRMTVAEKVGQMTQAERTPIAADPKQIASDKLGSVLSGGGSTPTPNTPSAWANMIDSFQQQALSTRLHIPLLYGIDSVHGDNNLGGATIFPHNIGLGATRDPALVRQVESVTAMETRATGPQWDFAPCVCVARDDRWGRTYESFGEDPNLVTSMETAIDGLQGTTTSDLKSPNHVLATAKHYAGDGLTSYGTGKYGYTLDQGIDIVDQATFDRLALAPYIPAVQKHHVGSIMPSYSSVDWTEDGVGNPIKMSGNKQLLTSMLKQQIGFSGFLISDYDAIKQLPGNFATQVRTSVNAGMDMFMMPNDYPQFESTLLNEILAGRVPMSRIDDAVSRILTAKFELGLFEHPYTNRSNIATIGSPAHRAVARQAVAESQVLLKNAAHALPLSGSARVYVAGSNANNIGNQAGGWTVTWQGRSGKVIPGTTILQGIQADDPNVTYSADASAPMTGAQVGIVVVGETPYAEGMGDVGNNGHTLNLSSSDTAAINKVCSTIPTCVVVVVSGRPQIITGQLPQIDALVASWLPGSEGEGVADVLFGKKPFTGKLPVTWPQTQGQEPINVGDKSYSPLFPFGFGLTTK